MWRRVKRNELTTDSFLLPKYLSSTDIVEISKTIKNFPFPDE